MAEFRIGVVDVIPIDPGESPDAWRVLTLRRRPGTRCLGSFEIVHGRIEPSERPEEAALRELREETGLEAARLYNVTCQPFYLHSLGVVELAVVFAAFVRAADPVRLGAEHDAHSWLPRTEAISRLSWPRSRQALEMAFDVLASGDAGCLEDVLRIR
jgi:8-oxo-dGTP pyrophosphatase MutT (NUDIX family)